MINILSTNWAGHLRHIFSLHLLIINLLYLLFLWRDPVKSSSDNSSAAELNSKGSLWRLGRSLLGVCHSSPLDKLSYKGSLCIGFQPLILCTLSPCTPHPYLLSPSRWFFLRRWYDIWRGSTGWWEMLGCLWNVFFIFFADVFRRIGQIRPSIVSFRYLHVYAITLGRWEHKHINRLSNAHGQLAVHSHHPLLHLHYLDTRVQVVKTTIRSLHRTPWIHKHHMDHLN